MKYKEFNIEHVESLNIEKIESKINEIKLFVIDKENAEIYTITYKLNIHNFKVMLDVYINGLAWISNLHEITKDEIDFWCALQHLEFENKQEHIKSLQSKMSQFFA